MLHHQYFGSQTWEWTFYREVVKLNSVCSGAWSEGDACLKHVWRDPESFLRLLFSYILQLPSSHSDSPRGQNTGWTTFLWGLSVVGNTWLLSVHSSEGITKVFILMLIWFQSLSENNFKVHLLRLQRTVTHCSAGSVWSYVMHTIYQLQVPSW